MKFPLLTDAEAVREAVTQFCALSDSLSANLMGSGVHPTRAVQGYTLLQAIIQKGSADHETQIFSIW
jgi:hypothetical protein